MVLYDFEFVFPFGYTFKAFAREINMPYTTLLSILNGSIGGAAMDNVLRISHALGFTIEELNQIESQPELPSDAHENDEALLLLIKDLPKEKKQALKILLASH